MIDIHSHILPGLDDGAQTPEDAIAMAQVAVEDGIEVMVATPHGAELAPGWSQAEALSRVNALEEEMARRHIPLRLVPGVENYLTPELPQKMVEGGALPLDGTSYILVEFPLFSLPPYTEEVLFQLQIKGFTPIIAHPERNDVLQKNPDLLLRLVERGMLAQVTAASLTAAFGSLPRQAAETMLRRRLVHIIASDAHSPQGSRSPVLSEGVREAARIVGEAAARAMVTAVPQAIVEGKAVAVEPPLAAEPRRTWAFWRR
ncbi:MAG: hypothetical protein HYU86_04950 [Chloroflexi bacterium]|nr:hypothetical protein [Chloroflexota bacterium]